MQRVCVVLIPLLATATFAHSQPVPAPKSFAFVRINYSPAEKGPAGVRGGQWATDFPDAELQLTRHLREIAPSKLNGLTIDDPVVRRIGDTDLSTFPLLYFVKPASLKLSEGEARQLRTYAEAGGLLMFDDFWGEAEWKLAAAEVGKIFPDRQIKDLELAHPLFHLAYDLKEFPQVLPLTQAMGKPAPAEPVHFRAVLDDKGRILALLCHNTDLGDGWERGGDNRWYAETYSLPKAFPIAANIVAYAMKLAP